MFAPALFLARRLGLTAVRCPVCGAVMPDASHPLCARCAALLPPRTGGYCPTCGHMAGREDGPPSQCPACRQAPPPWDAMLFHGRYEGLLRHLILGYKFHNSFGRSRLLADLAARTFGRGRTRLPDIIVPVPLHHRRLLWRGFNQSLELAHGLAKALDRPVCGKGLARTRNTVPQIRLGHRERQTNIKDAFRADPERIRGRVVLLVDDVYTTGATLRECARTLKRAGAAGVDVLVLARTQHESA